MLFIFVFTSLAVSKVFTKNHRKTPISQRSLLLNFISKYQQEPAESKSRHHISEYLKTDKTNEHSDDDIRVNGDDFEDYMEKFLDFAKSFKGILTFSLGGLGLIIIIVVIVLLCRKFGLCKCCKCRCCMVNAQPGAEQYGQVILNNEDDIDYGLESI